MILPVRIDLLTVTPEQRAAGWILECRITRWRPWPWKLNIEVVRFIGIPGYWRYLSDFREVILIMDHLDAVFLKWEYDQKKLKEKLKE